MAENQESENKEKYFNIESDIRKKVDCFNSRYIGRTVNDCPIMQKSLYLEDDVYNFCCIGVKSIPCIGLIDEFMDRFTKEFFVNRYINCFDELQSETCGICNNCTFLKKQKFIPFKYDDLYLMTIGFGTFHKCNVGCVYCGDITRNTPDVINISAVFDRLVSEDLVNSETQVILANGEPTIHKQFEEILSKAFKLDAKIHVRTNGLLFSDILYKYLYYCKISVNISVDSGKKETYAKIKRVDCFDIVWKNIKKYRETGGEVQIKYIIFSYNSSKEEIEAFVNKCLEANINYVVISAELNSLHNRIGCDWEFGEKEFEAMLYLNELCRKQNIYVRTELYLTLEEQAKRFQILKDKIKKRRG